MFEFLKTKAKAFQASSSVYIFEFISAVLTRVDIVSQERLTERIPVHVPRRAILRGWGGVQHFTEWGRESTLMMLTRRQSTHPSAGVSAPRGGAEEEAIRALAHSGSAGSNIGSRPTECNGGARECTLRLDVVRARHPRIPALPAALTWQVSLNPNPGQVIWDLINIWIREINPSGLSVQIEQPDTLRVRAAFFDVRRPPFPLCVQPDAATGLRTVSVGARYDERTSLSLSHTLGFAGNIDIKSSKISVNKMSYSNSQ